MFALLEYGTEMKKTLKQFQVQLKLSVEEIIIDCVVTFDQMLFNYIIHMQSSIVT